MNSWLYFVLSAVLCLLPNAFAECWLKLYRPRYFQSLQRTPLSVVEERVAHEKQQVAEKAVQREKEHAIVTAAVSSGKAGRRRPVIAARLPGGVSHSAAVEMTVPKTPAPPQSTPSVSPRDTPANAPEPIEENTAVSP